MNQPTPCSQIEERIAELADPRLEDADLTALRSHAADCGACGAALTFHRELAGLLTDRFAPAGATPIVEVPVPSLEEAPVLPLARWTRVLRPAISAAAILAVAVVLAHGAFQSASPRSVPVRVLVIDAQTSFPSTVPDQELLALTAGWEAVASLRPALSR